ncbi:MAG: YebC/PmpR family DNA-binding transcriptional regulator [Planctomycetes bacterium]|nr:YebC/PmpR family DNA-binding transcriptional regulator [Planctomycetota bacterium]
MAGHSHWAGIKHKKAAADKKRGKIFSKMAKYITVAAKTGGGDPTMNAALRLAIDNARAQNMPKDAIDRAIKKGTGELDGEDYVELVYEGFAPEQVALVVDILTDNRNRTASELRKFFEKKGGTLGNPGSVAWQFETKGQIHIEKATIGEEELMDLVLEAGADDMVTDGDIYIVSSTPDSFQAVKEALDTKEIATIHAEVDRVATTSVAIGDSAKAKKVLGFIEELEDHDDVQKVSANFDIPDAVFAEIEAE